MLFCLHRGEVCHRQNSKCWSTTENNITRTRIVMLRSQVPIEYISVFMYDGWNCCKCRAFANLRCDYFSLFFNNQKYLLIYLHAVWMSEACIQWTMKFTLCMIKSSVWSLSVSVVIVGISNEAFWFVLDFNIFYTGVLKWGIQKND